MIFKDNCAYLFDHGAGGFQDQDVLGGGLLDHRQGDVGPGGGGDADPVQEVVVPGDDRVGPAGLAQDVVLGRGQGLVDAPLLVQGAVAADIGQKGQVPEGACNLIVVFLVSHELTLQKQK